LNGQRSLPALSQRVYLAHRKGQPPRRLEPEGDRQRLLEKSSPGHQCVSVLPGESRARLAHRMQTVNEEVKSIPHLKHHGGINRILTCGSPVDELLRVTLDLCRQHTY